MSTKEGSGIQSYVFSDLNPPEDDSGEIRDFIFDDITNGEAQKNKKSMEKEIRQERFFAGKTMFEISPVVKKHRGIVDQEKEDFENAVKERVLVEVASLKKEAFDQAFKEGFEKGKEEAHGQLDAVVEEKITSFTEIIQQGLALKEKIFLQQKQELVDIIKTVSKWVIQRELRSDDSFILRVLEKIIIDHKDQSNVLVKVSQEKIDKMPEVIEVLKTKIDNLPQIRIEVDADLTDKSIIVETENQFVDASTETMMNNIDNLFDSDEIYE